MNKKDINIVLILKEKSHFNLNKIMECIIKNLSTNKKARFFLLVFDEKYGKNFSTIKNCEIICLDKYLNTFEEQKFYRENKIFYILKILKNIKNLDKLIYINSNMLVNTDLAEVYDKIENDKFLIAPKKNKRKYLDFNFFGINLNIAEKLNFFEDFELFLKHKKHCRNKDKFIFNDFIFNKKYFNKVVKLSADYNVFCDENYIDVDAFKKTGYCYNLLNKTHNNPKIYHILPFLLE